MEKVIIFGSGCAGLTAAIYTARANLSPLVIEGSQPGGQLTTTSEVENFPGFENGIDGFDLMDRMRKQASRFGTRFTNDLIESVENRGDNKLINTQNGKFEAQSIIIATGASPRLVGVPGEKEMFGGKGVTTCATCDGAFYRDLVVCVVGGGDSACEEALFLTRFCSKIYLIHRRHELRASKIMADRLLDNEIIEPVWNSVITKMIPDQYGKLNKISLENIKTGKKSELECKGAFIAIGHVPNTQPFKNILNLDESGYIIPEANSMVNTGISGLYAAGDCVDHKYRQAITAAGMGCQAAIECERWLSSKN